MGGCPTGRFPGSCSRGGRKKGLQTDLQNEIVQEIETLLGHQSIADLDFEAVEMAARRQALRLAARALEQRLNGDTSDHVGPKPPCPCGGSAQYHGRHGKTFESVLGPLHLQRAYYHCAQCESGFCPRDRALGLESFSLTPGVLRMTASAAALVSFEESSGLLHELAGVEVSTRQAERAAEALGAEIAVDEHQQVEKMGEVAPTMYLGMDGTGVPMRAQEVADRAGKQADGSAKTIGYTPNIGRLAPLPKPWASMPIPSARRLSPTASTAQTLRPCLTDPYLPFIRQTLEQYPQLRATRIYQMLQERGYQGSVVQLRRAVATLRPHRPEAFLRLHTFPAEQAQVDWAHFGQIMVGRARRRLSCLSLPCATGEPCIWSSSSTRGWRTSCAAMSTPFKPGRNPPT
jgi:hypothetical protein